LDAGTLRVTRTPDHLVARSRLAGATREVFPTYERLTFDKAVTLRPRSAAEEQAMPEPELCGPGHPLFDSVVADIIDLTRSDVGAGAAFTSPDVEGPVVVRFLTGDSIDGNDEVVHRAFATVSQPDGGALTATRTLLYDLLPAAGPGAPAPATSTDDIVAWARRHEFERRFVQAKAERARVADIQEDYLKRSFASILLRHQDTLFDLDDEVAKGSAGAEGRLRKSELAKAQVEEKRERRLEETRRGRNVRRGQVRVLATARLLPTVVPDGSEPRPAGAKHTSSEIEQIAVAEATKYEREVRSADFVKSLETDNVGFDLLSVTGIERRCIEVKGRAGIGNVELTWSEFAKAIELGNDYWLYVVLDCGTPTPRLYRVQNPAKRLASSWTSNLDVRYRVDPQPVIDAAEGVA
ncbi:MAG: DUF3883 domain-containing protein, partial [Actinobacteria bacterium]|nr:DUF3883 domain-containing protein [Actinomycetota bacterium]